MDISAKTSLPQSLISDRNIISVLLVQALAAKTNSAGRMNLLSSVFIYNYLHLSRLRNDVSSFLSRIILFIVSNETVVTIDIGYTLHGMN